jgi:hypothetical protein
MNTWPFVIIQCTTTIYPLYYLFFVHITSKTSIPNAFITWGQTHTINNQHALLHYGADSTKNMNQVSNQIIARSSPNMLSWKLAKLSTIIIVSAL